MKKLLLKTLLFTVLITLTSCMEIKKEKSFEKIDIKALNENTVSLFDDDWFIVTAGDSVHFNPMTISWGGLGVLWNHPVATVYIRPSRHTFQFAENSKYFTLCAFDEEFRAALNFIGTRSGRDTDKIKETGLTPLVTELGNIYYKEARLVIECEKIYFDDLKVEQMINPEEDAKSYNDPETIHRMYIGKIVNVLEKK